MPNRVHRKLVLLALALAAILIAVDFVIKNLVIQNFQRYEVVNLIPGFLDLTYVTNNSAAFSIGFGATLVFTTISTISALVLIWYLRKVETLGWAIMAGVLLAGIVGNLLDRFIRAPYAGSGQVVDYLKIPFNFPIFNLADMMIVTVACVTILRILLGHKIGTAQKVSKGDRN